MVTIEILQQDKNIEDEPTVIDKIQISEIEPFCISPEEIQNGIPISMSEMSNLICKISPIRELQEDERDSYFAQQLPVYYDGNLPLQKLDLPHHIGLRVVLENLLQKYGTAETLKIKIS